MEVLPSINIRNQILMEYFRTCPISMFDVRLSSRRIISIRLFSIICGGFQMLSMLFRRRISCAALLVWIDENHFVFAAPPVTPVQSTIEVDLDLGAELASNFFQCETCRLRIPVSAQSYFF